MDLSTEEGVKGYLDTVGKPYSTVRKLTGGSVNFVWRVTQSTGQTFILKHAKAHIRMNPSVAFSIERIGFEYLVLKHINATIRKANPATDTINVLAPEVITYDVENHMLFLTDGGRPTLKSAYETYSSDEACDVGRRLGIWLASLHHATEQIDPEEEGRNENAITQAGWALSHTPETLRKYGMSVEAADSAVLKCRPLLDQADSCACHGDFDPANIVLSSGKENQRITVIDWEQYRRGDGMTDVAQFAAEIYCYERFRCKTGILGSFLKAYLERRPLPSLMTFGAHFGAHLVYWPSRVHWAGPSETKELAGVGLKFIERAVQGTLTDWIHKLAEGWLPGYPDEESME
ncbi:MAG: hypothetical protein M1828_002436 [Chrysothrix sp. TS-e1954]|nr:MAG: hypothetical protein M1828_002436 [Chrysothrix sp. TS-e1954]